MSSIYICYFGVREPLVQTQVLPYLREIQKGDSSMAATLERGEDLPPRPRNAATPPNQGGEFGISLLTFEPNREGRDLAEFVEMKKKLAGEGIEWQWLPYHKRPSAVATAWDIFRGAWFVRQKLAAGDIDILHGRVHVPTLMGALGRKFSRRKPKLLFDIRGFFPEEYTDAGIWPEGGFLYRGAKRVERWLMKEADGFVVLTEKAREILFGDSETGDGRRETGDGDNEIAGNPQSKRPVEVIPCCVDLERRFSGDRQSLRASVRRELGIENRFVIVHVGALGGLYLTNEIADLLAVARERNPGTFALFLSQTDRKIIEPLLKERGFGPDDYFIGRVPPADIEGYLYASDVGLSIVKATFATQSRSPTKIPEYLACGLPIIANAGVGDVDRLILENGVGALLKDFSRDDYFMAMDEVKDLGNISDRCRETARRDFDLETVGGKAYRRIYRRLLS